MLKSMVASVLFILGVSFAVGPGSIYGFCPQEGVMATDDMPSLLYLIGQKCTVFLKDGTGKYGTLWEVGEDFVILKVKKGPLYSKEEKFAFSEIDYLEDSNGNKIQLTKFKVAKQQTENFQETETGDKYLPLGTPFDEIKEKGKEEKGRRLDDYNENVGSKSKQDWRLNSDRTEKPESSNPGLVIVPRKSKKESEYTRSPNQSLYSEKKTVKKAMDRRSGAKTKDKTAIAEVQQMPKAGEEAVGPLPPPPKKLRVFKYQTVILFSATLLVVILMFSLKIKDIKGYIYGKNPLFPARLVKINGEYGVIDQGLEDGVKVDDFIRFYRKQGRQVDYLGKVRVIKVADNYAAVKLIEDARNGLMEIGDVGFRDRSFILAAGKRLRKIVGNTCRNLAKGLDYAAKNLSMESEEPQIDVISVEYDSKRNRPKKTTVKKSKDGKKKANKPAVQSGDQSILVGFGMEDR